MNSFILYFEQVLCLRKGIGQVGGATPGKRILGLRVVSCSEIIELPDQRILVSPAGDMGIWKYVILSISILISEISNTEL